MQPFISTEGRATISSKSIDMRGTPIENPGFLAFLLAWVALFLVEWLVLSFLYAPPPSLLDRGGWGPLIYSVPRLIGRLVTAIAISALLLGGGGLKRGIQRGFNWGGPQPALSFRLGHLAACSGFFWLTILISREDFVTAAYPGEWFFAWAVMAVITLVTWTAAALPVGFARALAQPGSVVRLLAVAVVATSALAAGQAVERIFASPLDQFPLTHVTFGAVSGLVSLFCSEPVCRPEQALIGTRDFKVHLGFQCSGYEGIGLTLVFLCAYLTLCRRTYRFPHALLLFPLGVAAIWLANVARIALLIAVGVWISPAVAVNGFHSLAGWLAFNGIALGLVAGSRRIRFFTLSDPRVAEAESANPTAAFLVPLLAIVATMMITGAFTDGFDKLYPLRVLAAAAVLWCFRRDYSAFRWTWSWTAMGIGVGTFALWIALEPAPAETATDDALGIGLARLGAASGTAWFVFRVVGSVVIVPIAEELAFRGYLTRRLIAADFQHVPLGRFTWLSFLVSSGLFGALHGRWFAGILTGMLYSIALYRRRELADAVVAHATTNALIAAYVVIMGHLSLWA